MIYIGFLIIIVQVPQNEAESMATPEADMVQPEGSHGYPNGSTAQCKKCGWTKTYPTRAKAQQGLGAHSRFCKGPDWRKSPFSLPL